MKKFFSEFRDFIARGSVIDMDDCLGMPLFSKK